MTSQLSDPINPDYYKRGSLEAIDVIEAFFMHSPHLATAFKYLARMGEKPGNSVKQDAEKAKWYIDRWAEFCNAQMADMLARTLPTCGPMPGQYGRSPSDEEDTERDGGNE